MLTLLESRAAPAGIEASWAASEDIVAVAVVVASILSVAAILRLLSQLGGWRALARHYPVRQPFSGRRFHFQSLQLRGWVGYNGCVTAGSDPFSLYLSIWRLLRVGHPPLLSPWADVEARHEKRWWVSVVVLRFARDPSVQVRMSRRLAQRLAAEARGNLRLPHAA